MRYICVKGKCNLKCLYCNYFGEGEDINAEKHLNEVKKEVSKIKNKDEGITFGVEHYEPTTFSRFIEIVSYAKKMGFKNLVLSTNAVKLADFDYAKKVREAGIKAVKITLFGYNDPISDFVTNTGKTFRNKVNAINNCIKLGFDVQLTILMMTFNYYTINRIFRSYMSEIKGKVSKVVYLAIPDPCMGIRNKFLVPSFSSVIPYVEKLGRENKKFRFFLAGFPACLLESAGNFPKNIETENKIRKDIYDNGNSFKKVYLKKCRDCRHKRKKSCAGIYMEYLKVFGTKEFLSGEKIEKRLSLGKAKHIIDSIDPSR